MIRTRIDPVSGLPIAEDAQTPERKKCGRCLRQKPMAEFYDHNQAWDGKQTECIECARKRKHKSEPMSVEQVKAWLMERYPDGDDS